MKRIALLFLASSFSFATSAQLLNSMEMIFTELITPSFSFITPIQYENGITIPGSANISIISDQDWILEISTGGNSNFTTGTGDAMPVSDLSTKITTSSTWINLSAANQNLTTGLATFYLDGLLNIQGTGDGNATCSALNTLLNTVSVPCLSFTVDYKLALTDFYTSGTYNTVVYYTLTAQ